MTLQNNSGFSRPVILIAILVIILAATLLALSQATHFFNRAGGPISYPISGPWPVYSTCEGNACVPHIGYGTPTCKSDADCAPSQITDYDSNSPSLVYTGNWVTSPTPQALGGSYKYSGNTGDKVSLQVVNGKSFTITTVPGKNRGIYNIYIDETLISTYDGYGPTQYGVKIGPYPIPGGIHTISLAVSGQKNPASTRDYVVLDSIDVTTGGRGTIPPPPPPTTHTFDDRDPILLYAGNWTTTPASQAFAGSYKYSSTPGNRVTLPVLNGGAVTINTVKGINRGIYNIYINNQPITTFDAYGPTQYGVKIGPFYLSPSSNNSVPTISVEVSGQKNPKSIKNIAVIDSFEVVSPQIPPPPPPPPPYQP